jgi:hypothetical protein
VKFLQDLQRARVYLLSLPYLNSWMPLVAAYRMIGLYAGVRPLALLGLKGVFVLSLYKYFVGICRLRFGLGADHL